MWILSGCLRQKPIDLDLHCFQKKDNSRFSMTMIKINISLDSILNLFSGLELRVGNANLIYLFLNQNICRGYSKELSQCVGSFEHPKHMLKIMCEENIYNF